MLSSGHVANETFPSLAEPVEGLSRAGGTPRFHGVASWNQNRTEDSAMASAMIRSGDEVVFERLDVAEALGIWRHARGRIVGVHGQGGRAATVDVLFDGHDLLERYLPDLFRWVQ